MFNFSQNSEYLTHQEIIQFLNKIDGGFKKSSDPFFNDCNKFLKPFVKQGIISFDDEENFHKRNPVVCNVQGCNQEFETVFAYETHYNALHRYLCAQCKKSLPTPHLLDLHISEHHDSFFAIQSQRKPMFACFVEECLHKSQTPEERKDHCITIHKFPANYRFDTCSIGKTSKNKNKDDNYEMDVVECDNDINDQQNIQLPQNDQKQIDKKLKNFSFGHSKVKTFKNKNTNKKSNHKHAVRPSALECDETFTDLKESLPNE